MDEHVYVLADRLNDTEVYRYRHLAPETPD